MSDRVVPATFAQPVPKPATTLIIAQPQGYGYEVCVAVRGVANRDRDAAAALLLTGIAQNRWRDSLGIDRNAVTAILNYIVGHSAHNIGGVFVFNATRLTATDAAQAEAKAMATIKTLAANITAAEVEAAKNVHLAALQSLPGVSLLIANRLIEAETYGAEIADRQRLTRNVTLADVQRVARNLFVNAPVARVFVGDAAMLKTELARACDANVQVVAFTPEIGVQSMKAAPNQATTTPAATPSPAKRRTFSFPPPSRP